MEVTEGRRGSPSQTPCMPRHTGLLASEPVPSQSRSQEVRSMASKSARAFERARLDEVPVSPSRRRTFSRRSSRFTRRLAHDTAVCSSRGFNDCARKCLPSGLSRLSLRTGLVASNCFERGLRLPSARASGPRQMRRQRSEPQKEHDVDSAGQRNTDGNPASKADSPKPAKARCACG